MRKTLVVVAVGALCAVSLAQRYTLRPIKAVAPTLSFVDAQQRGVIDVSFPEPVAQVNVTIIGGGEVVCYTAGGLSIGDASPGTEPWNLGVSTAPAARLVRCTLDGGADGGTFTNLETTP